MKFENIIITLFLIPFINQAQIKDTIYLNEHREIIPKFQFEKKSKSTIYYEKMFEQDTIVYKMVFLSYFLGNLQKEKKEQIFKLLNQRNNVDTTKTVLIHYKDILKAPDSFPKRDTIVNYVDGSHRHLPSFRTFKLQHKSCIKQYKKDVIVYHFYEHNEGKSMDYNYGWFEDPLGLLKKTFNNSPATDYFWHIIIFPDGRFAININKHNPEMWNKIINGKKWIKYLTDFEKRYFSLNNGF